MKLSRELAVFYFPNKGPLFYVETAFPRQEPEKRKTAGFYIGDEMDTSKCSSCGQVKALSEFYKDKKCRANSGVQYHCKECIKQERREYYDQNYKQVNIRVREYHAIHPGRLYHGPTCNHAQAKLNREVNAGRVTKPERCQVCGEINRLHGHHWHGYDKPLDVIWLCPSCHHAAHGRGPMARGAMKPGSLEDALSTADDNVCGS